MRRYGNGTCGELYSLCCDFCEEEDWGYTLVTGRTAEAVQRPSLARLSGICPDCFEAMPEDWHNADDTRQEHRLAPQQEDSP